MPKNLGLILATFLSAIFLATVFWVWITPEKVAEPTPNVSTEEVVSPEPKSTKQVVGYSVEGRVIESYTYGQGSTTLLFVGGVHGGYEWNSTLLAYDFIDSLEDGTVTIPSELKLVIVPTLNPDGLFAVIKKEGRFTTAEIPPNDAHVSGVGRFNANGVDLNRNFDCKWQPESSWRGEVVSAGSTAFSEPESITLRNLVGQTKPVAVVFWHSQANTVYASECEAGVLPETLTLMNTYADAAGYNKVAAFDAYPITGDAEGWLASIGIPAVTVELETRTSSEWLRNLAGIEAILSLYSGN